jgi:hypothetical protein
LLGLYCAKFEILNFDAAPALAKEIIRPRLGNSAGYLCMTMHWLGWSRLAISSSLMIILETRAWTEFTSSSNMSARIGYKIYSMFTKQIKKKGSKKQDRFWKTGPVIEQWPNPKSLNPRVTLGFNIV